MTKPAKSTRKQRYKEFLKSDFWISLSAEQKRLFPECRDCGGEDHLQAHHVHYAKDWFDTKLSDLVTLCRNCHRIEHGLWVTMEIDVAYSRMYSAMSDRKRPSKEDWQIFKREQKHAFAAEMFGRLMVYYCGVVLRKDREFTFNVRDSIWSRHERWAHLAKNSAWRQSIEESKRADDAIVAKHSKQ